MFLKFCRWWKDLDIESKLPFARDRVVECYLWILGVYFEPCYSRGRIILTMVIAIATIFDDMFDSYGTAEECELLTNCIERFVPTRVNIFVKSLHVYIITHEYSIKV
jgi:hypothetical protein